MLDGRRRDHRRRLRQRLGGRRGRRRVGSLDVAGDRGREQEPGAEARREADVAQRFPHAATLRRRAPGRASSEPDDEAGKRVRRACGAAGAAGTIPPCHPEGCPSGRRSAIGNRVCAERCIEGSNPSPSVSSESPLARGLSRPNCCDTMRARRSGRVAEGGALLRR